MLRFHPRWCGLPHGNTFVNSTFVIPRNAVTRNLVPRPPHACEEQDPLRYTQGKPQLLYSFGMTTSTEFYVLARCAKHRGFY